MTTKKTFEERAREICQEQFESFEFLESDEGDHFLCEMQHKIARALQAAYEQGIDEMRKDIKET